MKIAKSTNIFWDRRSRRWLVVCGEVLYQADIVLVHDPNLFGDPKQLIVKALKIWSLTIVSHRMSSII